MRHTDGADIPAAITEIERAGWSARRLADDLQVHVSTVYRWRNGTRTPNPANFVALTATVNMGYAAENCRRGTRGVVLVHLQRAYELLETDADRARDDAKAEELAASMAAAEQRRQEAEAARLAGVRELATQQRQAQRKQIAAAVQAADRQPRVSVHAECDPFEIFHDSTLDKVEGIFA